MMRNIGRNIKAERVRHDMTQLELAKKLGLSVTGYNQKENGKRQFTVEEFVLICKTLETNPETMLQNIS